MTTMESLIGLVNRIQRACTVLGDYGGADGNSFNSLWEALPSVAVVGGQVRFFCYNNSSISCFFFFLICFLYFNVFKFCNGE
jgi:hypothetical protein